MEDVDDVSGRVDAASDCRVVDGVMLCVLSDIVWDDSFVCDARDCLSS